MSVTTKINPLGRDIELLVSQTLSPQARSAQFAAFAHEVIDETEARNEAALGYKLGKHIFVDGREGAALETVKPDGGTIVAEFDLIGDTLAWILAMLQRNSPVLTGRYASSHELFADGVQVADPKKPPQASEYVFLNMQSYARKVERWDSVYEGVAAMARGRFGNLAKIGFAYRAVVGGKLQGGRKGNRSDGRSPAIIVTVR
jgi:hypothetical protein